MFSYLKRRFWPAFLVLLLGAAPAALAEDYVVPLTLAPDHSLIIDVDVNGHGPFAFLVDTGASKTVILQSLVRVLSLPKTEGELAIQTTGGLRRYGYYSLGDLKIGDLEVHLPKTIALPARLIEGQVLYGALGADILSQFLVVFRFSEGRLQLYADKGQIPPQAGWGWIKAEMVSADVPVIEDQLSGNSVKIILDTGARVSVVNEAMLKALGLWAGRAKLKSTHIIRGAGLATSTAYQLPPLNLAIGSVEWRRAKLAYADLPLFKALPYGSSQPVMILGMDLLKQVDLAIDYEGSQIGFRIPPIKE